MAENPKPIFHCLNPRRLLDPHGPPEAGTATAPPDWVTSAGAAAVPKTGSAAALPSGLSAQPGLTATAVPPPVMRQPVAPTTLPHPSVNPADDARLREHVQREIAVAIEPSRQNIAAQVAQLRARLETLESEVAITSQTKDVSKVLDQCIMSRLSRIEKECEREWSRERHERPSTGSPGSGQATPRNDLFPLPELTKEDTGQSRPLPPELHASPLYAPSEDLAKVLQRLDITEVRTNSVRKVASTMSRILSKLETRIKDLKANLDEVTLLVNTEIRTSRQHVDEALEMNRRFMDQKVLESRQYVDQMMNGLQGTLEKAQKPKQKDPMSGGGDTATDLRVLQDDARKMHMTLQDHDECLAEIREARERRAASADLDTMDCALALSLQYKVRESVWDASILIGSGSLGSFANLLLSLSLVIHITVQVILCAVVTSSLSSPKATARDCAAYSDASEYTSFMQFGSSEVQAGPLLAVIAVFMWAVHVMYQLSSVCGFLRGIGCLLTTQESFMLVKRQAEDRFTIATVGTMHFVMALIIAAAQIAIAVCLLVSGSMWIINTNSIADLVIYAVALIYMMQLDRLIYQVMVPSEVKTIILNLEPLQLLDPSVGQSCTLAVWRGMAILLTIGFVVAIAFASIGPRVDIVELNLVLLAANMSTCP